jgi:CBS domain-containing protein
MSENQVRRLPVIDGHQLVGMLSQADLALNAEEGETGEVVRAISKE